MSRNALSAVDLAAYGIPKLRSKLPLVDQTRDFPFEKKLRVQRGDLQRPIGFHKENALGLHRCGSRFAAKLRAFYQHSANCLQLSSEQRIDHTRLIVKHIFLWKF